MLQDGAGKSALGSLTRDEILSKVQRLAGIHKAKADEHVVSLGEALQIPEAESLREWRIHFAPGPEMMLCGANPLLLIRELRQLGAASVHADLSGVHALELLDAERCYVTWDIALMSSASEDAIRDVFIFVADSCELTIEPMRTRHMSFRIQGTHAPPMPRRKLLKSRVPAGVVAETTIRRRTWPACAYRPPSWTSL